jgi:transcriptional regulator GlxA family with amidase domain
VQHVLDRIGITVCAKQHGRFAIWQTLVGTEPQPRLFDVRIVSPSRAPFHCGNAIPVIPDASADDDPDAEIVILPEIWLGPDESIRGRLDGLIEWIKQRYRNGATLYSACSGSVGSPVVRVLSE